MENGIQSPAPMAGRQKRDSRIASVIASLKGRTETLGVFVCCLALHAALIFTVLPPARFVKYQVAAAQALEGTLAAQRLMDFSPLYLHLHILAQRFFGQPDLVVLWLQMVLTGICAALLFGWLNRFFNRAVALAGALLFIIHPGVVAYSATFEPEPLAMAALMGFLVLADTSSGHRPLAAGVCLGLGLAVRANFFPLVVVMPFCYWLRRRERNWVRASLSFGLPIAVVLVWLTIRSVVLTGAPMPFGMNPGTVFFEGNNPNSIGQSAVYPPLVYSSRTDFPAGADYRHEMYRIFAGRSSQRPLSVPQVNAFWSAKALGFITDHPGRFVSLLVKKITYVFHDFSRHDIWDIHAREKMLRDVLPRLSFAFVAALALAGMGVAAGAWKTHLLAYAAVCVQVAVMLATYVSERQKMAILPLFFFFAAHGIVWLGRTRRRLVAAAGILVLACLLSTDTDTIADERHLAGQYSRYQDLMVRALVQRQSGDLAGAATFNAAALAAAPWMITDTRLAHLPFDGRPIELRALETALSNPTDTAPSRFDLGLLFLENGRIDAARSVFEQLAATGRRFNRVYHHSSLPQYYLARICALTGDVAGALGHLQNALKLNPGDPWVLSQLAVLTGQNVYGQRLERYFGPIDAAFFLGQAAYDNGRFAMAADRFAEVAQRLPEYRQAMLWHCLSLGRMGRYDQAAAMYAKAMALREDHLFAENDFLTVFNAWVNAEPQNHRAIEMIRTVKGHFGHGADAED